MSRLGIANKDRRVSIYPSSHASRNQKTAVTKRKYRSPVHPKHSYINPSGQLQLTKIERGIACKDQVVTRSTDYGVGTITAGKGVASVITHD